MIISHMKIVKAAIAKQPSPLAINLQKSGYFVTIQLCIAEMDFLIFKLARSPGYFVRAKVSTNLNIMCS